MSTLKVNKLRDTAGSADAITLDPNGGAVLAGVTTVSTVKVGSGVTISSDGDVFTTGITTSSTVIVGSGVTISESGIEASGIGITVANLNGGQFSNRNVIINGACRVAQRSNLATSQTGFGAVDRFQLLSTGASRFTLSQNDGPGVQYGLPSALKFETTTADSAVAATDYMYLDTRLEGQDLQRFQKGSSDAKQFTLQFWIKLAVEGTYVVQLFDADNSRHVVANYTVSSANTWEKKIITFPADTTGSFDNDNARSLDVRWHFMGGSNYRGGTQQTTWGSIVATNMLEGMGNAVSSTGDNFITGMQLEVGPQATSFEHRSFGQELALCQRYFYKIIGTSDDMAAIGFAQSSSDNYFNMEFPVPMRDYPTLTGSATPARFFSANIGQDFNLDSLSLSSNMTNANPKRVMLYVNQGGTSGGYGGALHFQNEEGFLEFSAEI